MYGAPVSATATFRAAPGSSRRSLLTTRTPPRPAGAQRLDGVAAARVDDHDLRQRALLAERAHRLREPVLGAHAEHAARELRRSVR